MANTRQVVIVGLFMVAMVAISFYYRILNKFYTDSQARSGPPLVTAGGGCPNRSWVDEEVVILTAGNEHFFDRMSNMIGSSHYWEPTLKVVVYDLGLTPQQVNLVKRMCNTEYLIRRVHHVSVQ